MEQDDELKGEIHTIHYEIGGLMTVNIAVSKLKMNIEIGIVNNKTMRKLIFIYSLLLLVASCSSKAENVIKSDDYYYLSTSFRQGEIDTIRDQRYFHDEDDTLIYEIEFLYKKKTHKLSKYTSWRAPVHGEKTIYELDTFGAVSLIALSNPIHKYLNCSNVEINDLFRFTFSRIIFESDQQLKSRYFEAVDTSLFRPKYMDMKW